MSVVASYGTLANTALPLASVVTAVPYSLPKASVLINVAPTIGVPNDVPSSVTCNVNVPSAAIVKLYEFVVPS